ncbi:MAG: 4Fe-4S binding protein [Candidatus Undinarchaeales archaeon]|nr:4Fe-4S binding protein [Candidatus Undinarchaeales archaeon]MDP7491413.1 4Fe-4S binding protein [Candidatus Undinarchaeales archaeon]
MVAVVNEDLCLHCGGCIVTCPVDASVFHDPIIIIDDKECVSCGACVAVCPTGAISLE